MEGAAGSGGSRKVTQAQLAWPQRSQGRAARGGIWSPQLAAGSSVRDTKACALGHSWRRAKLGFGTETDNKTLKFCPTPHPATSGVGGQRGSQDQGINEGFRVSGPHCPSEPRTLLASVGHGVLPLAAWPSQTHVLMGWGPTNRLPLLSPHPTTTGRVGLNSVQG